jgi:hypothetical protein
MFRVKLMQLRPRNLYVATTTESAVSTFELCDYLLKINRSRPKRFKFCNTNPQAKIVERIALKYG